LTNPHPSICRAVIPAAIRSSKGKGRRFDGHDKVCFKHARAVLALKQGRENIFLWFFTDLIYMEL
jgi:hypothetical protein